MKTAIDDSIKAAFLVTDDDHLGRPLCRMVLLNDDRDPQAAFDPERDGDLSDEVFVLADQQAVFDSFSQPPRVKTSVDTPSLPPVKVGDLVVATAFRAFLDCPHDAMLAEAKAVADHPAVIVLQGAEVVGHDMTPRDAVSRTESVFMQRKGVLDSLAPISAISFHLAFELAKQESHGALIAAWRDQKGEIQTRIVDKTGSYLFFATDNGQSCDDVGMETPDGPGIWCLENGHAWSTGDGIWDDYDCGLDGTPVPATADHLAQYGMTEEDVAGEIEDDLVDDGLMPKGGDPLAVLKAQMAAELASNCTA